MNSELGRLGDNVGAYRRGHERMLLYSRGHRREGAVNGLRKWRRHRSGRQQKQSHTHNLAAIR